MEMKVAIIDDAPINLTLLKHLVGRLEKCETHEFESSLAGLEWCLANRPDILIIDYMMPEMDGIEFLHRFRAARGMEDTQVLMVTANDQSDVRYRALEAGANDFLTKPIDKTEFLARGRNMLALRRSQHALANRAEWLASEVAKATADLVRQERETIVCLARAAEFRDPETGAHILRMAHYSKLIAGAMGLSDADQELLLTAAPMHDVGKVGIFDKILLKPGRLDPDEFVEMKEHARIGHDILSSSSAPLMKVAAEIALSHHEKFDGSGYPQGLSGAAIPLFGRIVAVADVFDALTSARPYKKAWDLDVARNFLSENAGSHFDPDCVAAFMEQWPAVLTIRQQFAD